MSFLGGLASKHKAFENTVRSEVLEILSRDLSERVFTTPWVLGVTSPVVARP